MDNLIVDFKRMRNEAIVAIVAQVEGPICRLCRAVAFQVCSVDVWVCSGDSPDFRKHFCIVKSSQVISLKAMKTYSGSKGVTLLILKFCARWHEWSASRTGRFIRGREPRYTLNRRLVGPRNDLDDLKKRKRSYLCQNSNPKSSRP